MVMTFVLKDKKAVPLTLSPLIYIKIELKGAKPLKKRNEVSKTKK